MCFFITKKNVNNFIVVVKLFWYYSFFIFLVICFLFLKRTLYNTWKSHCRQLHILTMIFNNKPRVNTSNSNTSPTRRTHHETLSFVSRIIVNECLKNSVRNCFSFVLILNFRKTIKTLGFHNNTNFLDLSSDDSGPCQTSKMERFAKTVSKF